ncbi:Gibberellin 2-beta-dioxygenase [Vigna angularis]|uniref:Gibberellin 2-beta-dioxygenase n=1 Tax=Phaseolus angularis TaxID=3914 RepID=A0A8T0KCW4_PHAAN|nr:Gibberellin 2-beta-dioxygenase [Vigna angularis]
MLTWHADILVVGHSDWWSVIQSGDRAQTHLHIWKPYTSRRLDDAHTHRSLNAVDDTPPRRLLVAAEECELPVIYLNRLEDSDETVKEEYKPHIARASQEWGFFQVVSLKYVSSLTTHRSRVSITQQLPTESERSISCDCSFEESHVVKMYDYETSLFSLGYVFSRFYLSNFHIQTLKRLSIPGTLPPQLAKLPFLQEVDFAYNFFIGSIPEGASMKLALILLISSAYAGELYLLAIDQGYINQPDLVWEKLNEVNGDSLFMTSNFKEFKVENHENSTWDEKNALTSTTDYLTIIHSATHANLDIK